MPIIRKACKPVRVVSIGLYINKAPVHLITFAGRGGIPSPAIALRRNQLPFWWNQTSVCLDINAYLRDASGIRLFLQPVVNHLSICNVLPQQIVDCFSETSKDRSACLLACPSMGTGNGFFNPMISG